RAGADVTLTDGAPATLAFAAENAAENRVAAQVLPLVWGRVPEALVERFDVVLAAEVVYERDQLAPLCGAVAALLRPGGEAWLADPDPLGGAAAIRGPGPAAARAARLPQCPAPAAVA